MTDCPDYCTSNREGMQYCRLNRGCKSGRRQKCPTTHSHCANGRWMFADAIELGCLVKCNDNVEYRVRCADCGQESSGIGNENYRALRARGFHVAWSRTDEQAKSLHTCSVKDCTQSGYEMHHFAPRNVFHDADDWPYLPLCRMHHLHWHQMMDGYRWHAKTTVPQLNTAYNNQLKEIKR